MTTSTYDPASLVRLLKQREAAILLGVGIRKLREMTATGAIPHVPVGVRAIRYSLADIVQWVDANRRRGRERRLVS